MIKFINVIYNQYYRFFRNVLKEQDIPAYNATVFITVLELFLMCTVINLGLMIYSCTIISKSIVLTLLVIILLTNIYIYHYKKYKDVIIHENLLIHSKVASKVIAFLFPIFVWGAIMFSIYLGRGILANCGYVWE